MISLELYRNLFVRILISLLIISTLAVLPALSQEVDDSQVFIAGFNAFQQKDYATSIAKMNAVLQKKTGLLVQRYGTVLDLPRLL